MPTPLSPEPAAAIIVAGGQGIRFGGAVRKQYLALAGRPILWWSLKAFQDSPSIQAIWLVVPREDVSHVEKRVARWAFQKLRGVTAGGESRQASVRCGLAAVSPAMRWVAVHDGVRPLVTPGIIEETLRVAQAHGAAIAACPSRDTIKIVDELQVIQSTPLRSSTWLAQTPQIFERSLLQRAHEASPSGEITDDAQLVERLGVVVKVVVAPAENLKVTLPGDLAMARLILQQRAAKRRKS